ncbi:hypothetical protein C2G38_2165288 [Gigaspora rosea]|uniref:Uncharacterized protein n=1 Tax=Gigaspora rosea TaxID=44941 RepID=A0A397W2W2_9GLOM|nr:hypothetical protein C2G38_2165288 [Gigaspora rosea]
MSSSEITKTVFTEVSRLSTIQNEKKLTKEEVVNLLKYFTKNRERVPNAESALSVCLNDDLRLKFLRSLIAPNSGNDDHDRKSSQYAIVERMKTFAKVLPWNKLDVIPTSQSTISLPDNICFLNDNNFGSKIFTQKAYEELWEIIAIKHPKHNFLITGSPGTGKTFFILFLLYILVGMGKTVIFQRYPDPKTYNMVPQIFPCNTHKIVVSSPNRDRCKQYEKGRLVDTRIMPTWDLEELEVLQQNIYLNTNFNRLRELYALWGGIPRYVVEKAEMKSSQNLLEMALASVDFNRIIQSVGNIKSNEDLRHCLIHITCNEEYLRTGVIFASKWVADHLLSHFEQLYFEEVKTFLFWSRSQPAFSGLRGTVFEAYAHKVLVRGNNTYRVWNLKDGRVFQKCFSAFEHVLFTQLSSIGRTEHEGKYLSSNHPIKAHGLENVMNIGSNDDSYELYFVVPPEIWDNFTQQKYINLESKDRQKNRKEDTRPDPGPDTLQDHMKIVKKPSPSLRDSIEEKENNRCKIRSSDHPIVLN